MKSFKKPELLSPVGSPACVLAAINNGCDAIYVGGKDYNARSGGENFTTEALAELIDFAHLRNVKVYITANTLYKNKELNGLFSFLGTLYDAGADAFIVQDIGVAMAIKKQFPHIKLHASTQMTVHSLEGVQYLTGLGFDRVVLSRELSLKEIRHITANTDTEIEVFAHGALCVSYSGQCTMSSLIGQRSGNRGKCAQTCRLKYQLCQDDQPLSEGYLLSPKDIMTLPLLEELVEANVTSLKLEGRMKGPEYVAQVTQIYRKQLRGIGGKKDIITPEDVRNTTQVFNRGGGFSTGYLKQYSGLEMMSTETPKSTGVYLGTVTDYNPKTKVCTFVTEENLVPGDGIEIWTRTEPHVGTGIQRHANKHGVVKIEVDGVIQKGDKVFRSFDKKLQEELKTLFQKDTRALVITGKIIARVGQPLMFRVAGDYLGRSRRPQTIVVQKEGYVVERATNKPLTPEKIEEQFCKTGNTSFHIGFENNEIDGDTFIPVKEMNQLRRDVLTQFEQEWVQSFRRTQAPWIAPKKENNEKFPAQKITVSVNTLDQWLAALDTEVTTIYVAMPLLKAPEVEQYLAQQPQKHIYVALPAITRMDDVRILEKQISFLEETNITGYLVRNVGQLELLQQSTKAIAVDATLNLFNQLSVDFFAESSVSRALSTELNLQEINAMTGLGNEIIVYGRLPVMTVCQCPVGVYVGEKGTGRYCKKRFTEEQYQLKDRKGMLFPIRTHCQQCYAEIMNADTLFLLDKMGEIKNAPVSSFRLDFSDEKREQTRLVITCYQRALANEENPEAIALKGEIEPKGITNGHFYRGVY